jgi:MFS transporter, AAHS family, 4-hydroxybenzoate transporter
VASISRPLTVGEIIDQRPLSRFQIWTITLCGVVLVLDGFDAQTIGFLAPSISETLSIPLKTFGPIFSASLFGLMIAAMATGPVADRWGRKWPVVISAITFGIFAVLTARATSFNQLLVFRFLTGLGLGGAMPNVVSLACEYSPKRLQTVVVAALFAGMPSGGFVCGMASSALIPTLGWRSVFYIGGLLPFGVALLLIKMLPESVRFLSVRGGDPRKISRIMARISPELTDASVTQPVAPDQAIEQRLEGLPVKHLFTEGRAAGTILLWVPFFMNLLILYFVVNWLPALLRQSGMSISAGVTATSLFSLGGIAGTLVEGPLMNACGAYVLLLAEFGLCALFIGSLAFVTASFPLIVTVTFVLGFCVTGAQGGINALAASFYPTSIRSTGVGWALGVGRIGSIVGPVLAGMMLSLGWSPQQVFLAGVVPAFCAAIAVLVGNRLRGSADAYHPELDAGSV